MNEEYRGFKLYGGCDSRLNHSNGGISELTRFTFPMNCDDEDVAKLFGLEITVRNEAVAFSECCEAVFLGG